MDELTEQIRAELGQIQPVLTQMLGWSGRWNGELELLDDPGFKGRKRYDCGIEIRYAAARTEARWRTLIHEMVHGHSAGLSKQAYERERGWEEGVVENIQRLVRSQILSALQVPIAESVFVEDEADFPFASHVQDVESMRLELRRAAGFEEDSAEEALAFYRNLLHTPLQNRAAEVGLRIMRLPVSERRIVLERYSAIRRRLSVFS